MKEKIDYVLFLVTVAEQTPKKEIEKAMKIKNDYFKLKQKKEEL